MDSVFSFVIGLLASAMSLLGFVQQHPELPQASRDQAQQVAQQAITQATQTLTNTTLATSSTSPAPSSGLVITYPAAGTTLTAGQQVTIKWNIPSSVTSSFPSDFSLDLFLNIVNVNDPSINVYGINDGTNDPRVGSVAWKVPADITPGSYKVVGYLQATPKDFKRMCDPVYSVHKDCMPNPTDAAVMQRVASYKAESGWFAISTQNVITPGSSQVAITGTYRVNGMIGIAKFVPDNRPDIASIGFTNTSEADSMFHTRFASVGDNCSTETYGMARVTGLMKNTDTSSLAPSHTATLVAIGPWGSAPAGSSAHLDGDLIEVICGEALSPQEAAARTPKAGEVAILLYYDDESKRMCYGESGICSMQYNVKTKVIPSVSKIADATLKQLFSGYFPELSVVYSDVTLVDGVAYVNFKKDGERYLDAPPGTSGMYMHSIKKTLLQFKTIKDVRYKIDGVLKTSFDM